MLDLGRMHDLPVAAIDAQGAWLLAGRERILLSQREVPAGLKLGEYLHVFVYGDATGMPVATLRRPKALVGEFAFLKVTKIGPHGAFLDWGMEKDLLVPDKEQFEPMQQGHSYVVKVRLDRQGRPLGTARIDKCLSNAEIEVAEGEKVDLLVWQFSALGAKVIVNNRHAGLLYRDEIGNRLNFGDRLTGFVRRIRADHKIDVTLRQGATSESDAAKAKIMAALTKGGGILALHDHSPPAAIETALGMSKKQFKKAVGGLYKAGLINLSERGISLKRE
ncbi:MAG: S1-like domain-containing RNA-binding protein [Desulfuromonadales bacterium]|nr:S1-like domain-containing RNA-binding protein [Desulfuromonadales bacterium]